MPAGGGHREAVTVSIMCGVLSSCVEAVILRRKACQGCGGHRVRCAGGEVAVGQLAHADEAKVAGGAGGRHGRERAAREVL